MNKVVLSGGSNGIGFELAKILSQHDNQVYSLDILPPKDILPGVTNFIVDVSDSQAVQKTMSAIGSGINVLINNAGIMRRGSLFDTTEDEFDLLFRINVKGSWVLLKEAQAFLAEKPIIVQMSSRHALYPPKDPAVYGLFKQTAAILASNLQMHYPDYIVKILYPGSTDTALSRYGVSETALKEKKKTMHSPTYVAEKIAELIYSDKTKLIFDPTQNTYHLE